MPLGAEHGQNVELRDFDFVSTEELVGQYIEFLDFLSKSN